MKRTLLSGLFRHRIRPVVLALCLVAVLSLSGCVPDEATTKALTEFQQSSLLLTSAIQSLLLNTNLTEQNHFIDAQVFAAAPLDPVTIQSRALLTDDQIKLRLAAIQAIADYLTALATLASGASSAQVQIDADKAAASLKTLTEDSARIIADRNPTSSAPATPDYSGPISAAASAIGQILSLLQKHRAQAELRDSIRTNDPQLTALFHLLTTESTVLYARQRSTLSGSGVLLFHDYELTRHAQPADPAILLQLSDRIKQFQRDTDLLAASDPAPSIAAFQTAHDALIRTILAPRSLRKKSLAELFAAVRDFAADVTPLAQNLYTLGKPNG